jgi:hypothetical protein
MLNSVVLGLAQHKDLSRVDGLNGNFLIVHN